jgi:hypothetical protein
MFHFSTLLVPYHVYLKKYLWISIHGEKYLPQKAEIYSHIELLKCLAVPVVLVCYVHSLSRNKLFIDRYEMR